ncbi:MAG: ABC transporter ATP-binding protein [Paludibacteraceae bacterium]|nr:ABC transporter ATP-binding protein [Paludibacteraceae bacterium]
MKRSSSNILNCLRPNLKWALLSPLLVGMEVCAELSQPYLMSKTINDGVLHSQYDIILPIALQMLIITIIGMIGGVLSIFAAGHVSYNFGADMRQKLFEKVSHYSFHNIDKLQTGSLITRITSDVYKVQSVIQSSMRLLFRSPFLFVGSVVMVLSISKTLSSVLLIILPILLGAIFIIVKKAYPIFMKIQGKIDRLNTVIQESLAGIRVVKAYTQEEKEQQRFQEANDDLIESNLKVSKLIVLLGPIMSLILNIGIAMVVYLGAKMIDAGDSIRVGEIMAITNYLAQILMSLMMAQRIIMSITEAKASMTRINEVFIISDIQEINTQSSTVICDDSSCIRFENVCFSYNETQEEQSDNYVLKNISFSIKAGETIGIVGGTGSGKSSLAQLIMRCYTPCEGSIYIKGKPINDYTSEELHQIVRLAMQNIQLFSGTIAENLRWGKPDATDEEMREACKIAQIDDFIESLDNGYNHIIQQGGVNFSGGQKQRISLARTLIGHPEVLVLDDCLNAIDLKTEVRLNRALRELDCTKIIVSQRISTIKDADRILLLENGVIIGEGSHDELLKSNTVYQEICYSQLE